MLEDIILTLVKILVKSRVSIRNRSNIGNKEVLILVITMISMLVIMMILTSITKIVLLLVTRIKVISACILLEVNVIIGTNYSFLASLSDMENYLIKTKIAQVQGWFGLVSISHF